MDRLANNVWSRDAWHVGRLSRLLLSQVARTVAYAVRVSTQSLTPAQRDRAIGVVLGSAVGDALGAGYEFTYPPQDLVPEMIGGGLGNFAPGEWTDDTAQAAAILRVAATGQDLRSEPALDAIARGFAEWFAGDPPDVGIQTRAVLELSGRTPTASAMRAAARELHERSGRSAGNGSLMRTGPVVLAYLDDSAALVEAAQAVSALTHFDPLAGDSCALWCLMIRHTVLVGEFPVFDDVAAWTPNPDYWRAVLAEAEAGPPNAFRENTWCVGALQAAWSAITHSRGLSEPTSPGVERGKAETKPAAARGLSERSESKPAVLEFQATLATAIRIGHDTDTVAAITGALAGAKSGAAAIPAQWLNILHGWPSATVDLEAWSNQTLPSS
jgi:ADP-ribosylglycohydrolase